MTFWLETAAGTVLAVKVQPGARRVQIGPATDAASSPGWPSARLKISVTAPPESRGVRLRRWSRLSPNGSGSRRGGSPGSWGATGREKRLLIVGGATEFAEAFASVMR